MMAKAPFEQQVTFLYSNDMSASAHFYEELLGLPLVLDQGSCRIYRVSEDGFLGLCQRADRPTEPTSVIVTLVTQDVDGWYERLQALGVRFEKEPTLNSTYNIYHCFLRDPNGYLLEIQTFRDPAWPLKR